VRDEACLDEIDEEKECNEKIVFLLENRWSGGELKKNVLAFSC
jgi:hypothetical protein